MNINPAASFQLPITQIQNPQTARPPAATTPSETAAPAETRPMAGAPEGVNPQLWGVLTEAEQAFFTRQNSMGPLTYGPTKSPNADAVAPRGQRIDVRV